MSKRGKQKVTLPKPLCQRATVMLVLGGLALFIGGCNSSSSTDSPLGFGSIHCRSQTCHAMYSEDFYVFEGDTIEITYDIVIDSCEDYDEDGRDCDLLSYADINLFGPPFLDSELIWEVEARSSVADAATITASQSGFYSFSVYLRGVEGEARVEWSVQRAIFQDLDPAVIGVGCGLVLGLVLVALGVLTRKMKQPGDPHVLGSEETADE